MTHYHINVRDAGGAPAVPSVKPPTAKPPRAPGAKPPAAPKAPVPRGGAPGVKAPSAGAGIAGIGQVGQRAAGLVNRASGVVQRVAGFGEEFNRDSDGHLHFNIPSRGARARDYGTAEGARKRSQGGGTSRAAVQNRNSQQSHTQQASYHKSQVNAARQSGNQRAEVAHANAYQAHSQAWRNPSPGNSAHAWGQTYRANRSGDSETQPYLNKSTPKQPFGKLVKPTASHDAGTSEGAKKAAQSRRQGGVEHGVRTGGNYGVDIKAGVNTRQVTKRPDPEPFRGYDRSRRK
jgi:hypothetical protein